MTAEALNTSVVPAELVRRRTLQRVEGLDTLRIVLAMWVVMSHIGFVPIKFASSPAGTIARGIYNNAFCGVAAVIVFFVISGFCIHFPYRHGQPLYLASYYARRHLRIWIPIAFAGLIGSRAGFGLYALYTAVLWSLIAEEIYYVIYPFLLRVRARVSWKMMIVVAYFGAYCVTFLYEGGENFHSPGIALTWILGLPCWLLGCALAEQFDSTQAHDQAHWRLWAWRGAAWFLSSLASVLRFHGSIGYRWTLPIFALFAFAWLRAEIAGALGKGSPAMLERWGRASYSLYLTHLVAFAYLAGPTLPRTADPLEWTIQIILILAACTAFFFLVEKPSHLISRKLGGLLIRKADSA